MEYCLDRDFHILIPGKNDWNPDTIVQTEVLNIYTDSSKLDNEVGSGVYSGKLDLNISLPLPDYCSLFQAEVMAIYRDAQSNLINGASFACGWGFSDSQAAKRSLSGSLGSLGNITAVPTFFLGAPPMSYCCLVILFKFFYTAK